MTHHKPSSLNNLQCQSSCSNLVSIPQNLIYILKLEQIEVVEWLLAGLNILKSSYRLWENINLPSVLLGKFEQKPGWECISSFAIQQHHQRTS